MDLNYPADAEAFRAEIRAWLTENLPEGWFSPGFKLEGEARKRFNEEWPSKLYAGGWICASWPTEYGGKGLNVMQNVVLAEEFARAKAPLRADFFGDTLVGPTILQWGTEEQKKEFLPKILNGQMRWCQGFSEPNSGSDLASLKTTAVLDGDEWVINGQKVWTTQAQFADYVFLLARTDPEAPKHKGISYLLVPMRQSGVEVRPIVQPDGTAEFNEVFFSDAHTDADLILGGPGDGWKVVMATLGFERGTAFLAQQLRFAEEYRSVVEFARRKGLTAEPLIRQRLAEAWTGLEIMRLTGLRTVSALLQGGAPGPESSIGKLHWSKWHQRLGELEMELMGADAQVLADGLLGDFQYTFQFSRAHTIYAGSSEVQRNIVGERVLGLPRDP